MNGHELFVWGCAIFSVVCAVVAGFSAWYVGKSAVRLAARCRLAQAEVVNGHGLPPGVDGDARVGEPAGRGQTPRPRPAHRATPVNGDGIARTRNAVGVRSWG